MGATVGLRARLRVVPTVLFSVLAAAGLGAALPAPGGQPLMQLPTLIPLGGIGLACAAFVALFAHPAAVIAAVPAAAVVAYFLSGDWLVALWTLTFALPIWVLRQSLAARLAATETVLRVSVACAPVWIPETYLMLGRAWGIWHPGEMLDHALASLKALLESAEIPAGEQVLGYTAEQAAEIAQLFASILPGVILFLCMALGWLAWIMTLLLFRLHGLGGRISPEMSAITVSRIGALVFAVSAVASLFGGERLGVGEALVLNLVLLLEPPLVLVGLRALRSHFRERDGAGVPVLVLVVLMLLSCSASILLLILALIGVVSSLRAMPIARKDGD